MNPLRTPRNKQIKCSGPLRNTIWVLFSIFLIISLSSCKPITQYDQPYSTGQLLLTEGMSIGQTFVARQSGLTGISVYLTPQQTPNESKNSNIILHLRADTDSQVDIAVSQLQLKANKNPRYYYFSFTPQPDSNRHYYYATLEIQGEESVNIRTASGNTYLEGALYNSNLPEDNQMTFRLSYDPVLLCEGLLKIALFWLAMLLAGCFLFIIPGWAILSWLWDGWKNITWVAKLGLSAGTSLVIYPILMLWTNLIRLQIGWLIAWLPPLGGCVYLIIKNFKHLKSLTHYKINLRATQIVDLCTIAVILLLVISRLWPIINLDGPMWGDSYQHTMITQLMIEHNGLFNSWQPYAEMVTFTYHFGFHSTAAAFHWITGLPAKEAVLWTGQLLNILAVIAIYPLAVKIGKNKWSGVAALLIAGIFSPMPATYINWGRYTQLAGQVILPAAVCLSWDYMERKKQDWRLAGLTWLSFGGLALAHYRVLIFIIPFLVTFILTLSSFRYFVRTLTRVFLIGLGGGLLFLPWFIHVFNGNILKIFTQQITTPVNSIISSQVDTNSIGNLFTYLPAGIWLLLPLCIGWGLWKQKKGVAIVSIWWLLLLLLANPQWLGLPGAGAITSFAVLIAFYIPAAILIGTASGWLDETYTSLLNHVSNVITKLSPDYKKQKPFLISISHLPVILLLVLLVGLTLYATRQRINDVDPYRYALVTQPDLRAADWVNRNLPPEATFLVNGFFAYNNAVIVGADGGWWLPLLTQRKITVPPLNYGSEQGPINNYYQWVNEIYKQINQKGITNLDVASLLKERKIFYIYIGQRQGEVNNPGPGLDTEQILASPLYHQVYHQDRVWIFEVVQ